MIYTELTKKAMNICLEAHGDQKDKGGVYYIYHPTHIAEQLDDEYAICVAFMHDIVEDTDYTLEDIKALGFPEEIVEAVDVITRRKDVSYMDYIKLVGENELARKVKIEDLKHNSDVSRTFGPVSDMEERLAKYKTAREYLENLN